MRDIGFFQGIVHDLTSGHGQLRLIIQPMIAIFLGARLGVADAKADKPPFLSRFLHRSGKRELFKHSLSDVIVPLCIGTVLDGIIQYYTLDFVRPVQAVVVALLLVWVPYSIARALINRFEIRRVTKRRQRRALRFGTEAAPPAPAR